MPSLEEVVTKLKEKGDHESASLVENLAAEFKASIPPNAAFETSTIGNFLDDARQESVVFFAPDFELLEEKLKLAEKIATENKDVAIGRTQEDSQRFLNVQDRSFANTLERVQGGFAGRGTANSGFRRGNIQDLDIENEQTKEDKAKEFSRFIADEQRGFSQFLDKNELEGKIGRRSLEVAREENALSTASSKQQESLIKNKALESAFDFLGQKSAA